MRTVHIIISFCIGLLFGQIFRSPSKSVKDSTQNIVLQTQLQLNSIDSIKTKADSSLSQRNRELSYQLSCVNKELELRQSQVARQRTALYAVTQNMVINSKVSSGEVDSLLWQLKLLNASTDSVNGDYEHKIVLTENLVAVRDSMLLVCERAYLQVDSLIIEQSLREQKLQADLATALRQQKNVRRQNRLLAAGMLFISGLTTSLIVKARQ